MSVRYQDYYAVLGVQRDADQPAIQKAYRSLARKHHPDVDKSADATQRFQQINEAYEVLKDPEKRRRYDQLGASWKDGQDFTPPAGFEGGEWQQAPGGAHFEFGGDGDLGGFSSFFESLFGAHGTHFGGARAGAPRARAGRSHEATLTIELEDALRGATRTFSLHTGHGKPRTYDVKIPPGVTQGSTIRLGGQGEEGRGGGPAGDLLLRIEFAPNPRFTLDGHDLSTVLAIAPWEAALGAKVPLTAADGAEITLSVPAGSSSGRKLRVRGQGLLRRAGERGDLYVELRIVVPEHLDDAERKLFEELRQASKFDPRA